MDERYQHDEFLSRWLAGELSETERRDFDRWLEKNPGKRSQFERLERIWSETGSLRLRPADVDAAWTKVRSRMPSPLIGRHRIHPIWRWATAAAVVLITLLSYWMLTRPIMVEVVTLRGETRTVTLPDRSEVTLNAESRIQYDQNGFDDHRFVTLRGEALFNVTTSTAPFIVESRGIETRVLGTSFNICARDDRVEVACFTGKVSVYPMKVPTRAIELTPGFATQVVARDSLSVPYAIDLKRRAGWIHGRLFFEQSPLNEVFADISRQLNIQIVCPLTDLTFTGMVEVEKPERAIEMICLTAGLRYRRDNDSVYVILK